MARSESYVPPPLCPGEPAPALEARNQFGESVSLSAVTRPRVLVMFYPFAFSPVCSAELSGIISKWDDINPVDAAVLAVSCDPMFTLRAFAEQLDAPEGLQLLSDFWPHGLNAQRWKVFNHQRGSANRTAFVLNQYHVIQEVIDVDVVQSRDIEQMIQLLTAHP